MYSRLNRYLNVLVPGLAILLTLGMFTGALKNHFADAAASSSTFTPISTKRIHPAVSHLQMGVPVVPPAPTAVSTLEQVQMNNMLQTTEPAAAAQPPEQSSAYRTTAHYLNVRTEPNRKSKVLTAVEKGTLLHVLSKTGNGWLELKGGGYVHGAYAKPVAGDASPSPVVVVKSALMDDEPGKPTSEVKSESGLTEKHIQELLEGTALSGHELETVVLEIEQEYGINAYFTIAVMKLESGNGRSRLAKNKNNLFGLNATGNNVFESASDFETKADCVRKFGQLISEHYVDKGFTTVEKVAHKYCPANSKWSSLVKTIMKRDYNLL